MHGIANVVEVRGEVNNEHSSQDEKRRNKEWAGELCTKDTVVGNSMEQSLHKTGLTTRRDRKVWKTRQSLKLI